MADMDGKYKYRQFGSLLVPETKELHVQTTIFIDLVDAMKHVEQEYMNEKSFIFGRAKQFTDNIDKLLGIAWKGRMNAQTQYFTLTPRKKSDFIDPNWVKPEDY